ncbi:hypothetical protein KGP17_27760 (plasmid) [Serratia sp. JSRIV001]|nr:hypothetical protein KGP17_27760 [Serratia sp. JSRIV001]UAN54559.1 hypothetical protein KGP26_28625 [Serratia sp. JSRIV002]UAN60553.1 hypothetical protein KGP21_28850 [Serratia sp. JSRIV004]UAN65854.1 hypothetical protein KGP16_26735 [Serratia sp. JSRIV006]
MIAPHFFMLSNIFNEENVTTLAVFQQTKQIRTIEAGTGLIFSIIVTDSDFMLTGKSFKHVPGALGVLFTG